MTALPGCLHLPRRSGGYPSLSSPWWQGEQLWGSGCEPLHPVLLPSAALPATNAVCLFQSCTRAATRWAAARTFCRFNTQCQVT